MDLPPLFNTCSISPSLYFGSTVISDNGIPNVYLIISRIEDLPLPLIPIRLLSSGEKSILVLSKSPPSNSIDLIKEFFISGLSLGEIL